MKGLTIAVALFFVCQALAAEHSALARVTVYWHREGSGEHAHDCAMDIALSI
jgi:hypothetical protein